ncbi:hypothetical protein E1B28_007655 [Marasmius oreades]|uniref:Uncharacterized protein n=1 Tax=Marasmius oreades TaxID=181124 RepID=A0A9P7S3T4_9AGAR|nr:uncharacterized protein E1B28_007655 [Marasmius oreades]KAG7094033.1 hypothetical protein E1B28_007655 [Marasmius oreades]
MHRRPDSPLLVKCSLQDGHSKKIRFKSAKNCTYETLKRRVEQCFALQSNYAIQYTDDNGETTEIDGEEELTEAIHYFQFGTDDTQSMSSAASFLSGRSLGKGIILRVIVTVDGLSLSDSGSLASLEEYQGRNRSETSFSLGAPSVDLDDDSVTVSSRDTGSPSHGEQVSSGTLAPPVYRRDQTSNLTTGPRGGSSSSWTSLPHHDPASATQANTSIASSLQLKDPSLDGHRLSASVSYPEDPSAVLERLKLLEVRDSSTNQGPLISDDRGAAWLRDQNERAIRTRLGTLPEPSESDGESRVPEEDHDQLGDLALEQDDRGRYYYSYNSTGSQNLESGLDEGGYDPSIAEDVGAKPRPTSRQLNWLASQRTASEPLPERPPERPPVQPFHSDPSMETIIPDELLQYVEIRPPPPDSITDCSQCGALLENMKYVCTTCGEKEPSSRSKGKARGPSLDMSFAYPPQPRDSLHSLLSPSFSSSSKTYVDSDSIYSEDRKGSHKQYKPLPALPQNISQQPPPLKSAESNHCGYELCASCIEYAGVEHAIEAGLAPDSSPTVSGWSPTSPEDEQRALQWRRAAPTQKGQLRHAYLEQYWGHHGWMNIEHEQSNFINCSACGSPSPLQKSYKCASCVKFLLCRACYSQVHDLHPSHAFLVMPEKPLSAYSEPDIYHNPDPGEEESMVHPGVKCYHCMQDIVGARFHCAICDSVDICSNCDAAGLPGNLDSDDGDHNSSHITIKIPFPLERTEVQTLSRRATYMWTRHPANNVRRAGSGKAKSEISSYARTVVGNPHGSEPDDNHTLFCNGCNKLIRGIRYQCGSCPSSPTAYSLCSDCEKSSYILHDSNHIFFKLKRPVDRPMEFEHALVPPLYTVPAGPSDGPNPEDLEDYLRTLTHQFALCDRHMKNITGVWYRCAYCGKDFCDECEAVDTHNDTHVFLVFKSHVDLKAFKSLAELDNPLGSPPVIPYAVYRSNR